MLKLKTLTISLTAGLLSISAVPVPSSSADLYVSAYVVKLQNGREIYVQGYECALITANNLGGTITGSAQVNAEQALSCAP